MKGYGQFCPVAKTAEVFAQRWTPIILRELCVGPRGFNDLLQAMPLISRTLLADRLRQLEFAGIVESVARSGGSGRGYGLTPAGEAFRPLIQMMSRWGQQWGQGRIEPDDLDPTLLVWNMRRHVEIGDVPDSRFVIGFEFWGVPKTARNRRYWWLVFRRPDVEVCLKNPGYDVDVSVSADLSDFTKAWLGYAGLGETRDTVMLQGNKEAVALAKRLLKLSETPTMKEFDYGQARPGERALV